MNKSMQLGKFLLWLFSCNLSAYMAFVNKPVIDVLGETKESFDTNIYKKLPYSWHTSMNTCPRIFQLILHEVVDVVEENEQEVKILVPNVYFLKSGTMCNEFWTLKENIMPLSSGYSSSIPLTATNALVKTLVRPYIDEERSLEFSVGTKFVITAVHDDYCEVIFYNISHNNFEQIAIPHLSFFQSSDDAIADFVTILRSWTECNDGFIPYVWGGASACYRLNQPFALQENNDERVWQYTGENRSVKSGFDCSALILRAAQIAGLPFYFRNTTTIAAHLKPLTIQDSLEDGDIIFMRGHVMVIASIKRNTCIEARSYGGGYGKVQEIHVQDLYKDITTLEELKDAYLTNKKVELLTVDKVAKPINDLKILKLKSIFNKS